MTGSALDRLLPDYQFVERHKTLVRASRQEVWRAVRRRGARSSLGSQA